MTSGIIYSLRCQEEVVLPTAEVDECCQIFPRNTIVCKRFSPSTHKQQHHTLKQCAGELLAIIYPLYLANAEKSTIRSVDIPIKK